jgi:alkylmercury lyase-like protein
VTDDVAVKLAVYRHTAEQGLPPTAARMADQLGVSLDDLRQAYARLAGRRLLVLEPDALTIRMAPPFSGVPTQHRVRSGGVEYFANCAWDALGIPAALRRPAEVFSRCGQSGEPLHLSVGTDGPGPSTWLFHCAVPAARWWQDIVFT